MTTSDTVQVDPYGESSRASERGGSPARISISVNVGVEPELAISGSAQPATRPVMPSRRTATYFGDATTVADGLTSRLAGSRPPLVLSSATLAVIQVNNIRGIAGEDVARETGAALRAQLPEARLEEIRCTALRMSASEAARHLGCLGYATSSLQRQHQVCNPVSVEAEAFKLIPGLEQAMISLGQAGARVPRDDAMTAWVLDGGHSFSGTDGEERFRSGVQASERLMGGAASKLLPLRLGRVSFADAVPHMVGAGEMISSYRRVLQDMIRNPYPAQFQAMRNHLTPYVVGGESYEPPNATYTPGWSRADIAVGNHDELFVADLPRRIRAMSGADAALVNQERVLPSVVAIAAAQIGLDPISIWQVSEDELQGRLQMASAEVKPALAAACDLARELAVCVGTHWGVILANLPDAAGATHGMRPTHDSNQSVAGVPRSHTDALRRSRKDHPLSRTKWRSRG